MSNEKSETLTITLTLSEYTELIRKAALYEELKAGRIGLVPEPRIIGGAKNE